MEHKRYQQLRVIVTLFVGALVCIAVVRNSYLLASVSVFTGIAFLALVRSTVKTRTDERELTIQEKAARMTYAVVAPTLGFAAFFMLLPSKSGIAVFSKGEWLFLETLGMVFAYLTLFIIMVYAISYHVFNRKYGGGPHEE